MTIEEIERRLAFLEKKIELLEQLLMANTKQRVSDFHKDTSPNKQLELVAGLESAEDNLREALSSMRHTATGIPSLMGHVDAFHSFLIQYTKALKGALVIEVSGSGQEST